MPEHTPSFVGTGAPIAMSNAMAEAVYRRIKTETRRPVKDPIPDGFLACPNEEVFPLYNNATNEWAIGRTLPRGGSRYYPPEGEKGLKNPYGKPDDLLWVQETHSIGEQRSMCHNPETTYKGAGDKALTSSWLHHKRMPWWASRSLLVVTDVHLSRLQDLTEKNAEREGMHYVCDHTEDIYRGLPILQVFQMYWDSLYGKKPGYRWQDNPWVFTTQFLRIEEE